jgi:hypothetical protein
MFVTDIGEAKIFVIARRKIQPSCIMALPAAPTYTRKQLLWGGANIFVKVLLPICNRH